MSDRRVYLDYNATAPLLPAARDAVIEALDRLGNPSSVHRHGREARAAVERARRQVAALAGAASREVVFTSGGTEADNLALSGFPAHVRLVSAIEHEAVLAAAPDAARIPVLANGTIDLTALDRLLAATPAPALVSVMWANNETGAIQPIAEVVAIARRHGALVHSDAVQAAGRVAIDFASAGLDLMTLSAHKLGGPSGAGALIVRDGLAPAPRNLGGGQELGRRSGTENLAGIAGFGAAAAVAADRSAVAGIAALRDGFEARLKAAAPEARILAADAPRLANTSCIAMPGVPAETQVMALDLAGIAVSAGAACSSGKVRRSHVLDAMEPGGSAAETAIRISLGWATEAADLDRLLDAWLALRARAGQRSVGHAA